MKILHFIYDHINNPWVGGGGAVRVNEIYKRLYQKGHYITIFSGKYPQAVDYSEGNMHFKFIGNPRSYMASTFSYAYEGYKQAKTLCRNYDVIIEDFAPWNPLFTYTLKNVPTILQLQNYLGKEILKKYSLTGFPFWLVEKFYPGSFKNFIIMVDCLAERYGITGNIKIISNGIENDYLDTATNDGAYILYLGRIDMHQKGLDTLVRAASLLPHKFSIAGQGVDSEKLHKIASGMDNIEFAGFISGHKKLDKISHSIALVVPSRYEGQGIVVLEAAACGKPVIVSDIPELQYAVDAGFGISFKTGDPDDLALKTRLLLANDLLRKEMGRKARDYAKNYTWDRIALDYEQFLLKVTLAP
ncbi:MAG: glycosyltransferase family 4 protein [Nitrospirae bacterium]|nr:glycosyltransferase family 4 protein [Nitrospirota bacterium]